MQIAVGEERSRRCSSLFPCTGAHGGTARPCEIELEDEAVNREEERGRAMEWKRRRGGVRGFRLGFWIHLETRLYHASFEIFFSKVAFRVCKSHIHRETGRPNKMSKGVREGAREGVGGQEGRGWTAP